MKLLEKIVDARLTPGGFIKVLLYSMFQNPETINLATGQHSNYMI